MAGFIPPHRQQQFLKACGEFFNWWLAELVQLLPQAWRNVLTGQQASCRLILERDELRFVFETQGLKKVLGRIHFAEAPEFSLSGISDAGQSPANQQLMANIATLDSEVLERSVLELADDYLLIRDISLPMVSDSDIASVLAHEIDRFSPFAKDNVCYSYEVLQKNLETGRLSLRLVCLERKVLENMLAQCAELGLGVAQVQRRTGLSRTGFSPETANLLPFEKRREKEKFWNSTNLLVGGLALGLLLTALFLPLWHYDKQIALLDQEVNALREQSKAVRAKQTRLVTALDIRDALVKRKNSEYEKITILHNLTRIIPDNTWLTRVTIRDLSLEIVGESDKSSDLIEKLESEEAFYQVEFVSPVTRYARTAKERFQIKMNLSARPAEVPPGSALSTEQNKKEQATQGSSDE